jgi:hypothetical protein
MTMRANNPRMMAIITVWAISSGDAGTVCAAADWNKQNTMEQTSTTAGTLEGARRVAARDRRPFCMGAIVVGRCGWIKEAEGNEVWERGAWIEGGVRAQRRGTNVKAQTIQ